MSDIPKNQIRSRNTIEQHEHEDDASARRVVFVGPDGNFIGHTTSVPLNVRLTDGSVNIGTVNGELEVQLSHEDDVPDSGDVHDSVRIGGGQFEAEVDSDKNLHVEAHGNDFQGIDRVIKTSDEGETVTSLDISENTLEERNFGITSGLVTTSGTGETDFILLRNPTGSGVKIRVYKSRRGISTPNAGSIVRTYVSPTVTTVGTPLTILPTYIKSPLPTSNVEAYFLPTTSNRGTQALVTVVPRSNVTVTEKFDEQVTIDPGFDVLFTIQNDNNNTESHLDIFWSEV